MLNISPKPTAQNAMLPKQKSSRFFMRMLTAFFARVKPVSTMAKPACIHMTRNAAIKVQTVSRSIDLLSKAACTSSTVSGASGGASAAKHDRPKEIPIKTTSAQNDRLDQKVMAETSPRDTERLGETLR